MALSIYKIGDYDHQAEREQFLTICRLLSERFSNTEENCIFIGNFNIGGVELDGLILKNNAIVIVEFKNWGGDILARENGPWKSNDHIIIGGSNGKNPFQQIKLNRSRATQGLKHYFGLPALEIQGVIVFNRDCNINSDGISPVVKKWLHVCDNSHFIEVLNSIQSSNQYFTNKALQDFTQILGLTEFSVNIEEELQLPEMHYAFNPAIYYYQELSDLIDENRPIRAKYEDLERLFNAVLHERTDGTKISFPNPFARMTFLVNEYKLNQKNTHYLNDLRYRTKDLEKKDNSELERYFLYDVKAFTEFINGVYNEPIFNELSEKLPKSYLPVQWKKKDYQYLIVHVDRTDDSYIYATKDDEDENNQIRISFTGGILGDWSYLKNMIVPGDILSLVRISINENGIYEPDLIIYQPDYLVNITTIASCFDGCGNSPYNLLINKIKQQETTQPILLGGFAGSVLDEVVYSKTPFVYVDFLKNFFRENALNFLVCQDFNAGQFHKDASDQITNIRNLVDQVLRNQVKGNLTIDHALLEPSFFSHILGLQGRMDFMLDDMSMIIEQKSGKRAFQTNSHQENHYVQILLYQALLRYNYDKKNSDIQTFLLYSKFADGLMQEGPAPKLLFEALRIRNNLAYIEFMLAAGGARIYESLNPDHLNPHARGGILWKNYKYPEINNYLNLIKSSTDIERDYFFRMFSFVSLEHLLSKIGSKDQDHSGFASLWNASMAEKKLAGDIFTDLSIADLEYSANNGVEYITLRIPDQGSDFLPNFRIGDIVILYNYKDEIIDATKYFVHRGSIKNIGIDTITVKLRTSQRSPYIFNEHPEHWAIEHDFMESSYNGLYQSVTDFLRALPERKELLLNKRLPRIDRTKGIIGAYGDFNELVLRTKQAQDYFIIIGPPGTGKTSFGLVNILNEELLEPDTSVLLLSFTNRAVDEICSKLKGKDFIRLGSEASCPTEYLPNLMRNALAEKQNLQEISDKIRNTRIFVGTTSSIMGNLELFKIKQFQLAIIDEASQILEPNLLGILCARHGNQNAIQKFVLIGDQKQLPAVVQQRPKESRVNEPLLRQIGLTDCRLSLFERLLNTHGENNQDYVYYLHRQGRMHREIAIFPNYCFYNNKLELAGCFHQDKPLSFQHFTQNSIEKLLAGRRVIFLASEEPENSPTVKTNLPEARMIAATVRSVYNLYILNGRIFDKDKTIGVIVPYRNQIAVIRREIQKYHIDDINDITIDTVERYQGSQRDVIIYGFTIQKDYQLDFLAGNQYLDPDGYCVDRKLNVALTRAREHNIIVGNPELLSSNSTFYMLMEYCRSRSAFFHIPVDDYCDGHFTVPPIIEESNYSDDPSILDKRFGSVFAELVKLPIAQDNRTSWPERILGNDKDTNRRIIQYGRADFSGGNDLFSPISVQDKVLLYCYYNMRKHYCSSKILFENYRDLIQNKLEALHGRCVFCDIGSGPGTSILAFAGLGFNCANNISYIGVDIAVGMQNMAKRFAEHDDYRLNFMSFSSLNEIKDNFWHAHSEIPSVVVFNFSFLFANVNSAFAGFLAKKISAIQEKYPLNTYLIINQNAVDEKKNKAYRTFRLQLNKNFKTIAEEVKSFQYSLGYDTKDDNFYYEIIMANE